MPLTINASARCFDKLNMTDEKNGVIPSVVEESRGNEFFLIPRGEVYLLFKYCAARVRSFFFHRGRAYADKNSALLQFIL